MNPRTFHRAVAIASLLATGCSWEWDRFAPGNTVDAGTDLGPATDVPAMDSPDVAAACATDEECARASADRPVCDVVSGRCVGCSPDRDTCGAGRFCAAATLTCATGCVSDQACATSAGDGGAGDGGVVAGRCDPTTHACVQCLSDEHCPIGTRCADRACVPGCDSARGCPSGSACCAGGCVDTAADPAHCGACGAACAVANAAPACTASRCGVARCNDGFGDCDGDTTTGCETSTRTSAAHCGACGTACAARPNATATCAEGACAYACAMGFGDCDGDPANGCEADLSRTLSDCGRCGNACAFAGGVGACVGGLCTRTACATGRGDCDGNTANGCEIDLQGDPANCRVCGAACSFARATAVCVSGGCAIGRCDTGFDNCDLAAGNGCEADITTSLAHCGACGRSCAFPRAAATCTAGVCALGACNAGAGNCDGSVINGCEVDLTSAVAHCGRCGGACPARANAVANCAAGACGFTCNTGFGNCDGNANNGCETSTLTSVTACGACGAVCSVPNAVAACRAGACAVGSCLAGFADCDGFPGNGCEVDTRTSLTHCGACNRLCAPANGVGACGAGVCSVISCNTNFANCDGSSANGCEVAPVANDLHCGTCGNACVAGRACAAGRCALPVFNGYDVTTPPGSVTWVDVCAAPGVVLLLGGEDDELARGPLEFPVEFWGTTNFTYFVSSNGWVGFGDYYGNAGVIPSAPPLRHFGPLPSSAAPFPAAYVLGVDLVQSPRGLCVATIGAAPNRRFVVESTDATLYLSTPPSPGVQPPLGPSAYSYELIAYEGNGVLDMVFNAPFTGPDTTQLSSPGNVTVGLQDYRTPVRAVAYTGSITGSTRIRFTPR
jgi:hypothetical protein